MLIFNTTQGQLLKDSTRWAGCQNNPIDVNLHLQKVWKVLIKNQLTNIIQKWQGDKSITPHADQGIGCRETINCVLFYKKNLTALLMYNDFVQLSSQYQLSKFKNNTLYFNLNPSLPLEFSSGPSKVDFSRFNQKVF